MLKPDAETKQFWMLTFQLLRDHETEIHRMRILLEAIQSFLVSHSPDFQSFLQETTANLERRDSAYALRSAQRIDDILRLLQKD